ncbi:uncharacterized protein LACBIDRAFT_336082 [Laccaria bicolor S238N-H82]|uniref:Predicted protein n=1 Tax=Laccaria bicolor (strain S238N-H82 / ATCC MYA-4686) TaxID=486041 RepID=B0E4C4_LACBS|nr:uncharacterized protein LACBIDRAFT_336082 [Laccaria bicolor S238N-H82]EDQ98308.1 predicted protein [Laccaria bicolor S238N-H82]|eukprot:XP_001891042.1 predicted protein [Laccaria bicolor S238N-H82]
MSSSLWQKFRVMYADGDQFLSALHSSRSVFACTSEVFSDWRVRDSDVDKWLNQALLESLVRRVEEGPGEVQHAALYGPRSLFACTSLKNLFEPSSAPSQKFKSDESVASLIGCEVHKCSNKLVRLQCGARAMFSLAYQQPFKFQRNQSQVYEAGLKQRIQGPSLKCQSEINVVTLAASMWTRSDALGSTTTD